jgi:hypothetical protein
MANVAVFKNKNQETTMFKKSIFIAAMLIISSAAFTSADAKRPIYACDPSNAQGGVCVVGHQPAPVVRDHRCPASQGGNCVGPEQHIQCFVAPCTGGPTIPPKNTECNDPRICDDFGQNRPPRQPPIIIVDPINPNNGHFGISCRDGRNIVKQHGFRRVHAVDCSGDTYSYTGRRHGEMMDIEVSLDGHILDVSSSY